MVRMNTPQALIGSAAPQFSIAFNGSVYSLSSIAGSSGTLVMFICNHCPYVKEIITNLVEDVKLMQANGIGVIAIMPNDFIAYPEDSPEKMIEFARSNNFSFPYVPDVNQEVARKYDAVCTPDFFGFNDKLELQYRGQFMDKETGTRDLFNAMIEIAKTGKSSAPQKPSIGCSIKWK
ncbi:ahpC/TSA family protein [Neorickettsia helminthoeca str. Oregon]|uniref:AhpC/TSA family protein n=1 Tax=Neorickettsia helminthoeca str. Oregon TaxID=1286528 RepID=X5HMP9_9RICK|nr:thioredoxin family protein [Neorickettsia helminthoeca]AHX11760.1 ahpC/TSA family protein [Neorickettsia helminthoeca str. Oregon]